MCIFIYQPTGSNAEFAALRGVHHYNNNNNVFCSAFWCISVFFFFSWACVSLGGHSSISVRSTVSGQRHLALRALAGVLRNRAAFIARGQTPPHPRLPETLPVAVRCVLRSLPPRCRQVRVIQSRIIPREKECREFQDNQSLVC